MLSIIVFIPIVYRLCLFVCDVFEILNLFHILMKPQLLKIQMKFSNLSDFIPQCRNLEFEKAYCLYRLNQVSEALKVVENVQNPSLKIKELKAQILYRLEKYEDCFSVYRDIIKNSNDEYEDERETNLSAVLVNLAIEGSVSVNKTFRHLHHLVYYFINFEELGDPIIERTYLRIDVQ